MGWNKIPWVDEVAVLTTSVTPEAVDGSSGAVGTSGEAARADHVHALGPLVDDLDVNQNELLGLVVEKLAEAPSSPVEGQVYFNTADKHLYVYSSS